MTTSLPPFETNARQRRFRPVPVRILIPNLITLTAVAAGMTAMRFAFEGKFEQSVLLIMLACLLDLVDGRIARMLKGTSKFGAQLDSLADFVNFGVAPAMILYAWQLKELKSVGWIVCIVFAVAVSLRLARFNVALEDENQPAFMANFFSGMPSPAGGVCALLPLYLDFVGLTPTFVHPPLVAAYTILIALLMVSTLPVYSGKKSGAKVPRDMVIFVFIFGVALIALLAFHTWIVMSLCVIAYMLLIPYGVLQARKLGQISSTNEESPL